MFSCELFGIFKSTFFKEHLWSLLQFSELPSRVFTVGFDDIHRIDAFFILLTVNLKETNLSGKFWTYFPSKQIETIWE